MIGEFRLGARTLRVDFGAGQCIALDLDPHGPNPAFYAGEPVRGEPLRLGSFVGSMAAGGSCNAEVVHFAPHCQGTHTEGVGHVLADARPVHQATDTGPAFAWLASVPSVAAPTSEDTPPARGAERLITAEALRAAAARAPRGCRALVLRTLPNEEVKRTRDYDQAPYPVLSREACTWLAARPFRHLLVDTPSLDPAVDGGALANHRTWWGLDDPTSGDHARRSVTEMIFVPDAVSDGLHWLDLGVSALVSDAAPSRPVLYPVAEAPSRTTVGGA